MKKYLFGALFALSALGAASLQAGVTELSNAAQFNQIVSRGNVVVAFYKPGCRFCGALNALYQAAGQFQNVTILKVNKGRFPGLMGGTVPHVRFYKNAQQVGAFTDSKQITGPNVIGTLKRIYG